MVVAVLSGTRVAVAVTQVAAMSVAVVAGAAAAAAAAAATVLPSSSLRTTGDAGMLNGVEGRVFASTTWVVEDLAMPQPPRQCRATPDTRAMAPCLTADSAMEADLVVVVAGATLVACAVLGHFDFCCFCCLLACGSIFGFPGGPLFGVGGVCVLCLCVGW